MSAVLTRPTALGYRVIIRPDRLATMYKGLVLPDERDEIPMSGTVVSVGKGSQHTARAYADGIRDALHVMDEAQKEYPGYGLSLAIENIVRLRFQAPPMLDLSVGDRVAFPAECGLELTIDETDYLVLHHDDCCVLLDEKGTA